MTPNQPVTKEIEEALRAHAWTPEEIALEKRAWMIGELMRDEPGLTRQAAERLIDEAPDCMIGDGR